MGNTFYTGTFDSTTVIVLLTTALSLYNAVELLLLIFTTFTSYRGLYFWSLLVASTGLIPYALGLIFQFFRVTGTVAGRVVNNVGWWTTVTGQSVVLYSRLGVVLGKGNDRILKYVKWMIIIDAILFHVTTTVVEFGGYYASPPAQKPFSRAYNYVEKIQMTGFCIQEFIISALYLWKTMDIVKSQTHTARSTSTTSEQRQKKRVFRVMWQLFIINIVIVFMDIALLVVEYKNLHIPEVAFKGMCYSVKLKLEFAVLSKLVEVAGMKRLVNSSDTPLDLTLGGQMESVPNVVVDSEFRRDDANGKIPNTELFQTYGSANSSPPEWLEDLEKIRSRPAARLKPNSNIDVEKLMPDTSLAPERKMSHVSTFNTISVAESPVHRRVRRDSDLLYADALRKISMSG